MAKSELLADMVSKRLLRAIAGSAIILALFARAAEAQYEWKSGFQWPDGSGLNGDLRAFAAFDDGSGFALYAGGLFSVAGGVPASNVAKWNGTDWAPLGRGVYAQFSFAEVSALTVFDDGTGPALYVGGNFDSAGDTSANKITKWDGNTWTPLGTGVDSYVYALTVFDDGTGPALYAGGSFSVAGGVPVNNIAKWDGTTWTPLGGGSNGDVYALAVFDDGTGAALYAGGAFTAADGHTSFYIARWDGTTWRQVAVGMNGWVRALTVYDDGSGPALYAGGWFTLAGGSPINHIAKWDGVRWTSLGSGVNGTVESLTVFDEGTGPGLYVGGGQGFTSAGGVPATHIARWDGTSWAPLGSGMGAVNWGVRALAEFDDGLGPALYAGGDFTTAGGLASHFIAKWAAGPWVLVWNDEFSSPDGSAPDSTKWTYDIGVGRAGWGNNELEYYTDRSPQNVVILNRKLVITSLKETYTDPDGVTRNYTSSRLKTQNLFSLAYGRFEARIKIPFGQGLWPAFWMLGDNIGDVGWPTCGEIDIMENIGREPSTVHGTVHGPGYSGGSGIGVSYTLSAGQRFADDFHIFAVEWEPSVIRFYVDDMLYKTTTPADLPSGRTWVFDHPFFVILNVAVGGNWPGSPDSSTVFPQTMLVDYVRVYQRGASAVTRPVD